MDATTPPNRGVPKALLFSRKPDKNPTAKETTITSCLVYNFRPRVPPYKKQEQT